MNNSKKDKEIEHLVDIVVDEVKKRFSNEQKKTYKSSLSSSYKGMNELKASSPSPKDSPPKKGSSLEENDLARFIDHTLLKPDATQSEIEKLCQEAIEYNFKTVCINSSNIALAAKLLEGKRPLPIAVVGFPLGAAVTAAKAFETTEAVRQGAKEIDMVINIGALKARDYATVFRDIQAVVEAAKPYPVKVILETGTISKEEIIVGCALSKAAGAAFVKTSTGFSKGGATIDDVMLMRAIVGPDMGVKASGGIRTADDAKKMIAAGANRLGASSSVTIVMGKTSSSNY